MRLILNQYNQSSDFVAIIGNYDGVHLGHQQLLARLRQLSQTLKLPSKVIVFEPQPKEFFTDNKIFRLSSLREKVKLFADFDINCVEILRFNHNLVNIQAPEFIQDILINRFKIKYLIIGDDFCFGCNRLGDATLLNKYNNELTIEQIPSFRLYGTRVSSSLVRTALSTDNFTLASSFLGRPYQVCGRIIHGKNIGSSLGFPTANIDLGLRYMSLSGVYVVKVHGIENNSLLGVANVGFCPTFLNQHKKLEVHILNFNKQIYGKRVAIEFCKKIRDEQKFASIEELKIQISQDCFKAIAMFTTCYDREPTASAC